MVALMSVDAKNNEKRVLFTITLGCHDACPGAFCECTSNSFAVRALVHLTGMWQWVPVLTVFNIVRKRVGTPADPATPRVTYEAIAVASTGVERELNDALDLDDGELGFVVRALIQKSNVHHYKGTNPWVVPQISACMEQVPRADAARCFGSLDVLLEPFLDRRRCA